MKSTNHYLCISPNTWGKGTSEEEAKQNADVRSNADPHTMMRFSHDEFGVDMFDGSVEYGGEAPTMIRRVR